MGCQRETKIHGCRVYDGEINRGWIGTIIEGRGNNSGDQLFDNVLIRVLGSERDKMFREKIFRKFLLIRNIFLKLNRIFHNWFQANSKIMLSVGGVVIVIASVACSLGIFGYVGVPTTLLTIEVSIEKYRM